MNINFTPGFLDDLERLFSWKYAPFRAVEWILRIPREIKYLFQRMTRGWADSDVWSMDSYLSRVVPEMLEYLKKNHNGLPGFLFDIKINEQGPPDITPIDEIAEARWMVLLDEMIAGFKAHDELHELSVGDDVEAFKKKQDEIEAKRIKGMSLFVEHFHSLWD